MFPTLTLGQVRKVSKIMKGEGAALPRIGIVWQFGPRTRRLLQEAGFKDYRGAGPDRLHHDGQGYWFGF